MGIFYTDPWTANAGLRTIRMPISGNAKLATGKLAEMNFNWMNCKEKYFGTPIRSNLGTGKP